MLIDNFKTKYNRNKIAKDRSNLKSATYILEKTPIEGINQLAARTKFGKSEIVNAALKEFIDKHS